MNLIITGIKFVIVSILSVFYWPISAFFQWFKGHYHKWRTTDKISYIVATPLYYFCFIIAAILIVPLEKLGEGLHPPLDRFK